VSGAKALISPGSAWISKIECTDFGGVAHHGFWRAGRGGWGLIARWNRAPLPVAHGDVARARMDVADASARKILVGAQDDGSEFVELLHFGCGERAIVDADVVELFASA
jgi:hypothetical protein